MGAFEKARRGERGRGGWVGVVLCCYSFFVFFGLDVYVAF